MAKGYSQTKGVDYNETFSPTANMTSIRVLLQLAAQHELILHQMDVKTAYLNVPIDCEIYIDQPEGFQIENKNGKRLVYTLNKSFMDLNSQRETGTLSYTHILLKTTLYRINLTLVSTQCPMTMKPSIS